MPTFHRETTLNLEAGARPDIRLRNLSGNVTLRGEDRGDVQVTARARFVAASDEEANEMLADLTRRIRAEHGRVEITTPAGHHHGGFRWGRGGFRWALAAALELGESESRIDCEVTAPRGAAVEIELTHGDAFVQDFEGHVRLQQVNGSFAIQDVGRGVTASIVNGRGSVVRAGDKVDVRLTNGRLRLEDLTAAAAFELVNGAVEVVNAGGALRGNCIRGNLEITGAIRDDVLLHVGHGRIVLNLPADSWFALDASSGLGSVSSELDVRDAPGDGNRRAPRVSLRSETGDIELRKLREPANAPS